MTATGPLGCAVPGCGRPTGTDLMDTALCSVHMQRRQNGLPTELGHEAILARIGDPDGYGRYGILDRDHDGVTCHECGARYAALVQHLRQAHAMTVAQYRDVHGLPKKLPLTSLRTSEKLSETSVARMGSAEWLRFEAARDASLPQSQRVASRAAAGSTVAKAASVISRAGKPAGARLDDAHWNDRWAAVTTFRAEHGFWPRRAAADPIEKKLADWLRINRTLYRRGNLPPHRAAAMGAHPELLSGTAPTPKDARRDQIARAAGWPDWDTAMTELADLTAAQAAKKLGCTRQLIDRSRAKNRPHQTPSRQPGGQV